jgi:uncharacterized ferritin-like protein (DUF455 family)
MKHWYEWAEGIVLGPNLEDKLAPPPRDILFSEPFSFKLPDVPARSSKTQFSDKQIKFPKKYQLHEKDKMSLALNAFANHELLALEIMAEALLYFPHNTEEGKRFKRGIISALVDEQKHFSLYTERMNELGYEFGDFPLNDFFWRQMGKLTTPEAYIASMSLTFEAANLDFSRYYSKIFSELGDEKTSNILETVYLDEISHVAFGFNYLKRWSNNKTLWDYYQELLPWPLTPARSKGISFHSDSRFLAGMSEEFVHQLIHFEDPFRITKRKDSHEKTDR